VNHLITTALLFLDKKKAFLTKLFSFPALITYTKYTNADTKPDFVLRTADTTQNSGKLFLGNKSVFLGNK
jgi:hypothetical protein